MAVSHIKNNIIADFTGTVTVFNSAGSTQTVQASQLVRPSDWNSVHNQFLTLSGNTAGASTMSGSNIILQGGNNITLSADGASLIISAGAGGGGMGISAGTQSVSTGTMIFADSNGMAFGMSGSSQITASYTQSTHSHATAAFSGSNGSFTADTVTFGNLNGLSFYTSNGSMVGSHNALTTARASTDAVGLGTAQTNVTWTVNSAGISLNAAGYAGTTTAVTGNAVITLNSLGMRFDGAGLAGTTTAITGRAAITMNSGGFQFNGSGLAGTGFTSTTTAGTAIVATNSTNGLSLAFPTIITNALTTARASNDAIGLNTAQTNVTWTVNSGGLSFNAAGYAGTGTSATNASITLNSNGLAISVAAPGGGAAVTVSDAATSGTVGQLAFTNLNGVTLSLSTGAAGSHTIVGSHNALTSQSNQNVTAANGGFAFQTLSFSNANAFSFGTSAGSAITGSYTVPVQSNGILDVTTATQSGTATSRFAMHDHQHRGIRGIVASGTATTFFGDMVLSGGSNVTLSTGGASTAGTIAFHVASPAASNSAGSFTFQTLNFSNANNVTFGTSAGGIITASVAAPGAAAEANAINLLGANTAGNTTATGSTIGWSGQNITLSGTNGSQIVISAPATSSLVGTSGMSISTAGSTISILPRNVSRFDVYDEAVLVAGQQGQNTLQFMPQMFPCIQFDMIGLPIAFTATSNSSGSFSATFRIGFYTQNVSTLSLLFSTSTNIAATLSGTVGSYSNLSGFKRVTIGATTTLPGGQYFVGIMSSTSTAGAAGMTMSQYLASQVNSNFVGNFGVANNATNQYALGVGIFSVTSAALPGSVAFSGINGTGSVALRPPAFFLQSGTA